MRRTVADAEDACSMDDPTSCANAWDTVEELSAEQAHQKSKAVPKDPMEEYCEGNEDADECRVHDN